MKVKRTPANYNVCNVFTYKKVLGKWGMYGNDLIVYKKCGLLKKIGKHSVGKVIPYIILSLIENRLYLCKENPQEDKHELEGFDDTIPTAMAISHLIYDNPYVDYFHGKYEEEEEDDSDEDEGNNEDDEWDMEIKRYQAYKAIDLSHLEVHDFISPSRQDTTEV